MVDRLPRMLGADTEVACVDGRMVRYANLDHAASTPVMADVWAAVEAFVPWYSSVHRGTGFKSQVATAEFEGAREAVARFIGARPGDHVVFARNTTEAINVLAASLPAGTRVLRSLVEHHANMLPWRRHDVRLLPFTRSAGELLDAAERALRADRIDLLAVTGASNVTGEVWPVAELAELAHDHGAALFVDAAQLAPHRAIDIARAGIDLLAFSGHKLAERRRCRGARGRLPQPARARHGRGRGARAVARRPAVDAAGDRAGPRAADAVAARVRRPRRRRHLQPRRLPRSAAGRDPQRRARDRSAPRLLLRPPTDDAPAARARRGGAAAALRAARRPPPAAPGRGSRCVGLAASAEDVDRLVSALCEIAAHGPRAHYEHMPEHDQYRPLARAAAA